MLLYWSNWFILFPFAMSMFVAMRLSRASIESVEKTLLGAIIRAATVMLMWFAFLAIGLRGGLGIIWLVIVCVLGVILWRKRRRLERNVMFFATVATEHPAARAGLLSRFADEVVGQLPRLAGQVANRLIVGVPWGRALEQSRVGRGVAEVLALRLLDRYGRRGTSKLSGQGSEYSPLKFEAEVERLAGRLAIFGWVFAALPLVTVLLTFIVPTFIEMFDEFGIPLPVSFEFFVGRGSGLVVFGMAALMLMMVSFVVLTVLVWLFPTVLQAQPFRILSGGYFRSVGFSALSTTARLEKDLPAAFHAAGQVVPVFFLASRFDAAGGYLASGLGLSDALVKSRLVSQRELRKFGMSLTGNDAIWALQQYSNWCIDRMLWRYNILTQVAVIATTFALAVMIGLVSLAFISALSAMTIDVIS